MINVPSFFSGVWYFIKMILSKKTQEKVKIFKNDYHEEMHRVLGKENLPEHLGGYVKDWKNNEMPWDASLKECHQRKSWFRHQEERVSDPMVKAQRQARALFEKAK